MSGLIRIHAGGRDLDIEHAFVGVTDAEAPWLVFLHEGLGSLSMWRDFPQRLCEATRRRGLVYSRPGYGRSTPRHAAERWPCDFMHRQADEVLPALMQGLDAPPCYALFGHSDGGSVALLHAANYAHRVSHAIVLAPHIMVEPISVASIERTRETYLAGGAESELRRRLSRHHADVDSAFWGWNDIWLDDDFRRWSIEENLARLHCRVLAIQGEEDEYGTMAQIDGIAAALPAGQCRLLKLPACGHSPHRDQPQAVIDACVEMLSN